MRFWNEPHRRMMLLIVALAIIWNIMGGR